MSLLTRIHSVQRIKPEKWPVQYSRIAPEWRWAYRDLGFLLPMWGGGGGVFDLNSGRVLSFGTGVSWGENPTKFVYNGANDANLLVPNAFDWGAGGTPFTLLGYQKYGSLATDQAVGGHDADGTSNWAWTCWMDTGNTQFGIATRTDGGVIQAAYGGTPNTTDRFLVGISFDGVDAWKLWVDGEHVASITEANPDDTGTTDDVWVGAGVQFNDKPHFGDYYAAYLWRRELTQAEHEQLARDPFGPFRMGRQTMVFVPTTGQDIAVGQAIETDLAMSIGVEKSVSVGQAEETDLAQGVSVEKAVAIAQAVETDSAFGIDIERVVSIGQATEIDEALLIDVAKALSVGLSIETSQAFSVTALKEAIVNVGQAVETNFAQGITARKEVGVGLAQETDEGFVVTPVFGVAIGQAVETNEAFAIAIEKVVPIGQAVELDSARPVSAVLAGPGGTVPVFMYYYRQMRAN